MSQLAGGIKHVPCDFGESGPSRLAPGSPGPAPHAFPFADSASYSSTATDSSWKDSQMLNSSSESQS